jgi:hypothetical protein
MGDGAEETAREGSQTKKEPSEQDLILTQILEKAIRGETIVEGGEEELEPEGPMQEPYEVEEEPTQESYEVEEELEEEQEEEDRNRNGEEDENEEEEEEE